MNPHKSNLVKGMARAFTNKISPDRMWHQGNAFDQLGWNTVACHDRFPANSKGFTLAAGETPALQSNAFALVFWKLSFAFRQDLTV